MKMKKVLDGTFNLKMLQANLIMFNLGRFLGPLFTKTVVDYFLKNVEVVISNTQGA